MLHMYMHIYIYITFLPCTVGTQYEVQTRSRLDLAIVVCHEIVKSNADNGTFTEGG